MARRAAIRESAGVRQKLLKNRSNGSVQRLIHEAERAQTICVYAQTYAIHRALPCHANPAVIARDIMPAEIARTNAKTRGKREIKSA